MKPTKMEQRLAEKRTSVLRMWNSDDTPPMNDVCRSLRVGPKLVMQVVEDALKTGETMRPIKPRSAVTTPRSGRWL